MKIQTMNVVLSNLACDMATMAIHTVLTFATLIMDHKLKIALVTFLAISGYMVCLNV